MSRSCHSATFSSPTSAFARTTRASPQMRSATTGLRLCGIADAPALERAPHASPPSVELERPARELEAEGRRLGVHAVRAAHLERQAVLLGASENRRECAVEALEHEPAGLPDLQRESGVDHVR